MLHHISVEFGDRQGSHVEAEGEASVAVDLSPPLEREEALMILCDWESPKAVRPGWKGVSEELTEPSGVSSRD